jgi:hypothetical protein
VDGLLSYSKDRKEFKLGQEARAYGDAYQGNMLLYNEATNTVHFEGKLNLLKPQPQFAVEASGSGNARTDSSLYDLDAFLAFDMKVPAQALSAMAENLRGNSVGAVSGTGDDPALLYKLGEFIGDKEVRRYVQQSASAYVPLPKLSKRLVRSLILSEVKLQWSNEQNAWYSVGGIGLASILKEDINTQMDGYVEIKQDMNGMPAVNLYLQTDPYNWYYFSFFENSLTMASSDDKFNKVVGSKSRGSRGSTSSYGFYLGEAIEKNQFLEHYRNAYLNGKDGFKVVSENVIKESTGNFEFLEEDTAKDKKKRKKKNRNDPFEEEE